MEKEEKNKSLKKDAIILTVSKMVNLIITMITAMMLSRFRSLEEYGIYSELSLVLSLLTTLCLLGIPNAINYFLPRTESFDEKKQFLETFFSLNTILSVIAGVIMAASLPIMAWYFKNKSIYGFYYFAILMPWAKITIQERSNLFVANNKTNVLIRHTIGNSILLLGIVLVTKIFNQNFQFYMILYVLVELFFAVLVYFNVANEIKGIRFKIDKELCKRIFKYSIPIGVSDVVNTISKEIDKLMIGGFLNTAALAIYTNSAREISLTVISSSFIAIIMPNLSKLIKEKKKEDAINIWKSTTEYTYIFMCFGVTALIVFAPQVMTILYSEKYLPGVNVFRIYSLILLWRTAYFGTMLSLHGKTKKILECSVLAMIINILLNYILYKMIGFTGPAWSTFISIGIVNILQLKLTSKIMNISIKEIFPWKKLMIISIVNILMGGVVFAIIKVLNIQTDYRSCIISIIIGIIWLLIYFGLIMKKEIKSQKL